MRKIIMSLALCALLFTGCGKSDIAKTYEQSEQDGIIKTYYEMKDGTWQCEDTTYPVSYTHLTLPTTPYV